MPNPTTSGGQHGKIKEVARQKNVHEMQYRENPKHRAWISAINNAKSMRSQTGNWGRNRITSKTNQKAFRSHTEKIEEQMCPYDELPEV